MMNLKLVHVAAAVDVSAAAVDGGSQQFGNSSLKMVLEQNI